MSLAAKRGELAGLCCCAPAALSTGPALAALVWHACRCAAPRACWRGAGLVLTAFANTPGFYDAVACWCSRVSVRARCRHGADQVCGGAGGDACDGGGQQGPHIPGAPGHAGRHGCCGGIPGIRRRGLCDRRDARRRWRHAQPHVTLVRPLCEFLGGRKGLHVHCLQRRDLILAFCATEPSAQHVKSARN